MAVTEQKRIGPEPREQVAIVFAGQQAMPGMATAAVARLVFRFRLVTELGQLGLQLGQQ
ncbi:hypothetical protein H4B97_25915 [Pseudomonas juntendi]|uniref:Uncharacterized protein n=1 Tax=Pseudomonas juntendi TaxID=2666183 RepID=A0A7W2LRT9_9PSED|nr:hypothetical protein [Pseudomonas juntendi]